jgi:hypothetical protein
MQIGDEIVRLVFAGILQFDDLAERAKIVADMDIAGWLDTGENDGLGHGEGVQHFRL